MAIAHDAGLLQSILDASEDDVKEALERSMTTPDLRKAMKANDLALVNKILREVRADEELEARLSAEIQDGPEYSCWQDRDANDAGINPYGAL